MMKRCQLEQVEPKWQKAQNLLQVPGVTAQDVDQVIQMLEDCSSLSIASLEAKASSSLAVEGGPGTGSPEKQ